MANDQYTDNAKQMLIALIDAHRATLSHYPIKPIRVDEINDMLQQMKNSYPKLTDEEALDILDETKWWMTPTPQTNNTQSMSNKPTDPALLQLMQSVKAMSNKMSKYNNNQQSSSTLSNPIQNNVNTTPVKTPKKAPKKVIPLGTLAAMVYPGTQIPLTPTHSNTQIQSTAKVKQQKLNYPNTEQKIAQKLIDALGEITKDNTSEPQARIEINNNTQTETLLIGNFEIQAPLTEAQVFPALNITPIDYALVIKSSKSGKTFITITEDEIIIGDVNKEHIRLKQ